jgi:DNA adenine methylase
VRQSFFGLGAQRENKGWHMAKSQNNSRRGETVSRWNNAIEKLYFVAEVIRSNFQITNYDFSLLIDKIDFPKAFFYCDPPYPKECRTSFDDYLYEFTTDQHVLLSERLHNIEGMAMVSSYESDLYNDLYADWRKIEFPIKKNNIRSGDVKEVIWVNYDNDQVMDLFNS